jgi:putative transposase
MRRVSRTAMVSLEGNRYQVDPSLVGRRVELRYNPEDMSIVTVHDGERPAGVATPFVLGQHTHPAVPQAAQSPAQPTGIDYLGQVMARHDERTEGSISFRNLADPDNNNTEDHQ